MANYLATIKTTDTKTRTDESGRVWTNTYYEVWLNDAERSFRAYYVAELTCESGYRDLHITKDGNAPRHLADLFFHTSMYPEAKEFIEVCTKGYGDTFDVDSIQAVIDGYENAREVAKLLTRKFIK